jgi:hypothetical protein
LFDLSTVSTNKKPHPWLIFTTVLSKYSIKTIKGLLSQDFTIKAYDYIANNNKALLYQIGLDDEAITNFRIINAKLLAQSCMFAIGISLNEVSNHFKSCARCN